MSEEPSESYRSRADLPVLDYASGQPPRLVVLATFSHPFEAHLAAGKLDTQGIRAVVTGDALATIGPQVTGIGGAVRLLVAEEDLVHARAVLPRRLWAGGQPLCPACGSDLVRKANFTGWRGFLDGLLFGLPRLVFLRPLHCEACGYHWVPKVHEEDEGEDDDEDQAEPAADDDDGASR